MEKKETTEQTQMTYEERENNIIWFGVFSMKFKQDCSSKVLRFCSFTSLYHQEK